MKSLREFLSQNGPGRWGFALTLLLVFLALAAPWISPADPTAQNLAARLVGPSAAHWMGTDELGRDILSRILYGTRISMIVSVSVVLGGGLDRAGDWLARGLFRRLVRPFREHRADQCVSCRFRGFFWRLRSRHFSDRELEK